MLTEAIKSNITSLGLSELESLCEEYLAEHGAHTEDDFINHLFQAKKITVTEYKNIQTHEKIELISVSDINEITGQQQPAAAESGETTSEISGTYLDNENYTVLDSIDEGAMGEILIARDNKLNRTVAYKKIHDHVAEIPSYLGRFFQEAQVTAQLQHPNIVPVYGLMVDGQHVGYTMKLIDGVTLKDHIRETMDQYDKHGEPDEYHTLHARLDHFLKVCDAMHYAHRKGVIHRDLKPLNIMIGPYNEVYVMDWGIAKTVDVDKDMFGDKTVMVGAENVDQQDKTRMGQVMGTPAYMSPEQAEGELDILDHRSDLYALGLILFELVTLHRAISGKTSDEVMMKARRGHIDQPPRYGKQDYEQEQLLAIVKKATQYMPEDRYETVAEFADDIRRFMHGEAIKARPESTRQKFMRWVTYHRKAAVNIIIYSVLVSFTLVVALLFMQMQSMKELQSEDTITNRFVSKVAVRAQNIDTEFLKYQAILEGLTIGATNLLIQGNRDKSPYFTNETIDKPGGPEDFKFSEVYGMPISVAYHVYKLAPGVSEFMVKPTMQRLNPLRHSFRNLMLKSHGSGIVSDDINEARRVIMEEGLPLVWSYVGLEEGLIAAYPGKTGYPDTYDPRQRPWYRSSIDNKGIQWLQPYIDVGGRGVLLPCTSPIYDNEGYFLGVAGVEITLNYIRKRLMSIFGFEGLEATYLVNDKGEIVVSSEDKNNSYGVGTLINYIDQLELFPNDYVVRKIAQQQSGEYMYFDKGREKFLTYQRLNSTGWYLIAVADAEELLAPAGY